MSIKYEVFHQECHVTVMMAGMMVGMMILVMVVMVKMVVMMILNSDGDDNLSDGGDAAVFWPSPTIFKKIHVIQINANHLNTRLSFVDLQNWDGCSSGLH